jgi:hypothetical protein
MSSEHFKGPGRFDDRPESEDREGLSRTGQNEGLDQASASRGTGCREPVRRSDGEDPLKVISMDSRRRRGVLRDPYKLGLLLQLCLTLLLISLLVYSLFPFLAVMDRLEIPIRRVIYIPLAIVAVVVFFARRTLRLLRQLKEERR